MRIIGGNLKGKHIFPPKNFSARPTTDFAKEGIFNILANLVNFEKISVLDIFSGTGSIGYEFASRGTQSITSVEMNHSNYRFIKKTITELGISGMHAVHCNAFDFLDICRLTYDLVFADPPYDIDNLQYIPDKILSCPLLKKDGLFIMEHPAGYDFSKNIFFIKMKNYGSVHFSIFKKG